MKHGKFGGTLWWTNSLLLKMAIEIVDFPIKNGDFPLLFVCSPEGIPHFAPRSLWEWVHACGCLWDHWDHWSGEMEIHLPPICCVLEVRDSSGLKWSQRMFFIVFQHTAIQLQWPRQQVPRVNCHCLCSLRTKAYVVSLTTIENIGKYMTWIPLWLCHWTILKRLSLNLRFQRCVEDLCFSKFSIICFNMACWSFAWRVFRGFTRQIKGLSLVVRGSSTVRRPGVFHQGECQYLPCGGTHPRMAGRSEQEQTGQSFARAAWFVCFAYCKW